MAYSAVSKRDRLLVLGALVVLAGLAWGYTIHLGVQHASMVGALAMPMAMQWTFTDFVFMLVMWAVMMLAMVLPSVTPTVVIFGRVREKREATGRLFAPTGVFVCGYLLAWLSFSLIATIINWWLHTNGLMSSSVLLSSFLSFGSLLIVAGLFQWMPAKDACLDHCRSPMSFLMQHWREGTSGAMIMGLHHGAYCLGCCWMLMLLLFALGVMNIPWIALLTILVLAEKTLPYGRFISRSLGVLLIGWGAWLIATA